MPSGLTSRTRWLALGALAAWLVVCGAPSLSRAYQPAAPEGNAAAPEGQPVAAEAPPATDAAAQPAAPKESYLAWAIRASGICGLLILICSFILVAVAMMIILQVRRDNFLPAAFIEAFEQKLNAKDYQGAYEIARADDSFLARVLAAGMGRLARGYEEAVEGMQEVGEDENMAIDHKLSYIALIGSVTPMLGLLGTVLGMITSFRVIATSTAQPAPKDLADGIATALFTTMEGLAVAIPAIAVYGLLKNRVARLVLEVGIISEGLMGRFAGLSKSRAPGGAAPATAPAGPAA